MIVQRVVRGVVRGAVIGLVLSLVACNFPTDGRPSAGIAESASPAPSNRQVRAYSLLANNHLLVADLASGATIAELTLATAAPLPAQIRGLALSADGARLFALVRETEERAFVAAIDTSTLTVTARLTLAEPAEYRGLSVGPRTGRLYVYALRGGDAIVTVLDSRDGSVQTWVARPSDGRSWWVYQGMVTADESTLLL